MGGYPYHRIELSLMPTMQMSYKRKRMRSQEAYLETD